MRKSIGRKIFAYFICVEVLILFVFWIGVTFFIEGFYYKNKIAKMQVVIDQIAEAYKSNNQLITANDHFAYIGYTFEGKVSVYENTDLETILNKELAEKKGHLVEEIWCENILGYIYEYNNPMQKGRWLIYSEEIGDGLVAILEIPVETINETIEAFQNFFLYLFGISLIIASIFSMILSRNISKPVRALNNIAKEMGKLNFKEKYSGNRKDEIGQLGNTLNDITGKLEKTILDLQHELAKEKQLDILRNRFVAQVSHELQTPLSVINGYIEALQDGIVDEAEEMAYYYEVINDETSKMSKIVRELLDLSQLESGTFKMNKEELDIICLMDDISYKFQRIAKSKHIKWEYVSVDEPKIIIADSLRLEQGITNIINNAFKHTQENGKISFSIKNRDLRTHIVIENQGEKIPEEQLSYIWESFYKAKTSDKKQGTGLGLAIAANIFKYHRFDYYAYNTENGVAFEIIINDETI